MKADKMMTTTTTMVFFLHFAQTKKTAQR